MIRITMNTNNDAFFENYDNEAARILFNIANDIRQGKYNLSYRDSNGNKICTVEFIQD